MAKRMLVNIDENKCNGCGLCVPNCAEGAIKIINGKAKLVAENLCDGLGACLGHCPLDAIKVEEQEAEEFDEMAVEVHLKNLDKKHEESKKVSEESKKVEEVQKSKPNACSGGGCPGSRPMSINHDNNEKASGELKTDNFCKVADGDIEFKIKPQLEQWPVQLMLVPTKADYFDNADLLVTADCVPFAYPNFHLDILKGKKLVVGCPKLDNTEYYTEKLTEILKINDIKSLTVAFMEVPCCTGLVRAAQAALANSGKDIPLVLKRFSINGEVKTI